MLAYPSGEEGGNFLVQMILPASIVNTRKGEGRAVSSLCVGAEKAEKKEDDVKVKKHTSVSGTVFDLYCKKFKMVVEE